MIIYGWKSSHLKSAQFGNVTCPACNTQADFNASVYAKYAHVFWIPFFSLGRTGASQCLHCKRVYDEKEMPAEVKRSYLDLLKETRIPLWSFVGLGLVALLVVSSVYTSGENAKKREAYFAAPAAGDVYQLKMSATEYTTFKIESVDADSLYVRWNNYSVDKATGFDKLEREGTFAEPTGIARTEITEMKNTDKILQIDRVAK